MQHTIYIRDELVLEAYPDPDNPYILLRREGEPEAVRVYLNEVRYLADALCSMAVEVAGCALRIPPQRLSRVGAEWALVDAVGGAG